MTCKKKNNLSIKLKKPKKYENLEIYNAFIESLKIQICPYFLCQLRISVNKNMLRSFPAAEFS